MKSFDLVEPWTLEEAVALLDPEDAGVRVLAGGTALHPALAGVVDQQHGLVLPPQR